VKENLVLPSKLESIDQSVLAGVDFAKKLGFSDDDLFAIDMAMRETVANAVKHGNKFDETKAIEITFLEQVDKFEIAVRDFGNGFEVLNVPDPTDSENIMKTNGRGILFMRNFMDGVEWKEAENGGTIVKMWKNR
jgi:serine/threonine-protein kinase RsbW